MKLIKGERSPGALSNNSIWDITEDNDGIKWIATENGLDKYDPASNTFQHYKEKNENNKRKNQVWEIFEDRKDQLWIGTYLGGLKRLDKKRTDWLT